MKQWAISSKHIVTNLAFQGYCAYTLVNQDRLLIPANPEVGVLCWREHYYAFSSKMAAEEFAVDPDGYVI